MKLSWKALAPIAVAVVLALLPVPEGLAPHAWYFFAIFASVVWLIFGAFMFALGYEKPGLGKRIALVLVKLMGRRTLTLGCAVTVADTILAPFTPSNTARSGGTIYPVIRNLPMHCGSRPDDPSARKIGSCLMWVAIASTCVTSSMFLTALAPNLLAVELVDKTAGASFGWAEWFIAFASVGIGLLVLIPLITYWVYPPEVKSGDAVPKWAGDELLKMGALSRREVLLAVLVLIALLLWIFGGSVINATPTALVVISLMLLTRVVTWDDRMKNHTAWNTLAWFATRVALADGLNKVGFVKWFANAVAAQMTGFTPFTAMVVLVLVFHFTPYPFASVTAHVTALLPVMLAVGAGIPGLDVAQFALLLCLTLGIMGVLTPYATGPSPVYYGSGYLPAKDCWRLGAIFGLRFIVVLLVVGLPRMALIR